MRRRRKRDQGVSQEPAAASLPEEVSEDPSPHPILRILIVGQGGARREALEAIVEAQSDMELVGVFEDVDSGISGIRASTKRSGVVVLVDADVMETGSLTEIRGLRDRFPSCRFLAYGDAFGDDAASALLFFGADAVAGVSEGPAAVTRTIRRSVRPDEHVDTEPDAAEPVATGADVSPPAPEPAPAPQPAEPTAEWVGSLRGGPEPEPEPQPEPEPAASPSHEGSPQDAGAQQRPISRSESAEEIWQGTALGPHREPSRRMTPEDIWDQASREVSFEPLPTDEPEDGERPHALGRSARAVADAGGRVVRTLRKPFRPGAGPEAERPGAEEWDDRSHTEDPERPSDPHRA